MGAIFAMLEPLLPYIIGAVLLFGGLEWDNHRCNAACQKVTVELNAANEVIKTAHDRADFLAGLYAKTLLDADKKAQEADHDRIIQLAAMQARIKALSSTPTIHLSAADLQLHADAASFANATRPPAVGDQPAAAIPDAGVTISEQEDADLETRKAAAYRSAYDHWASCVAAYQSIQHDQQTKGASP